MKENGPRLTFIHRKPNAVVHFAEQRAAQYPMKSPRPKIYTVDNSLNTIPHLPFAIVETKLDINVIHLGTMGVYGYTMTTEKPPRLS